MLAMPEWLALPLPWYEVALRLSVALGCGAVIGFDREQRGHAAGLRTHMLIALGAATFALVGVCLYEELNTRALAAGHQAPGDPLRTISGVVSGIGFLGAGAILHHRGRALGLTTAAGIWSVAAIGVASGTGFYFIALTVAAMAFITLAFVGLIEKHTNGENTTPSEKSARG
jgi:putative Mg2+ transporter-C (MgtC) family protein